MCPIDEGLLSESNVINIWGGSLVGEFQLAVLRWQGSF